jgi:hypothetical protein
MTTSHFLLLLHLPSLSFQIEDYDNFTFLLVLRWKSITSLHFYFFFYEFWDMAWERKNTVQHCCKPEKKKGKILEIFILSKFSLFFFLFQSQNWTGRFSKTATGSMVQTVRNGSGRFFTDFDRFCRLAVHSKRPDRCCDRFPVQPVQPAGPVRF